MKAIDEGAARARPVVAIDGPAGAGKSTAAKQVARALGYVLVDTGALYRAVAFASLEAGISLADCDAVSALCEALVRTRELWAIAGDGARFAVALRGRALGDEIRTPEVSLGASTVSAYPRVRAALLDLQRGFGAHGGVVLEGRDIGTVVFPDAEVKVFLTASPEQRAQRRFEELTARGESVGYAQVLDEVRARDKQDSERAVAPLRAAEDAVCVDSTAEPVEQVVQRIVALVRSRGG